MPANSLSAKTMAYLRGKMKTWVEEIFGLTSVTEADNARMNGVMQLLIDIRKEAKGKKDFATSDKIRNQLAGLGITIKDEKDGGMSWQVE